MVVNLRQNFLNILHPSREIDFHGTEISDNAENI